MKNGIGWSTEYLVLFGKWLTEKKNEHGYGLLCIHASCLGLKVSNMLDLTWRDFIEEINNDCKDELVIKNTKNQSRQIIPLSGFIQRYTQWAYENDYWDSNRTLNSKIYVNLKTGKALTTSTLNRELNRYYDQFKSEVLERTYTELRFEPLKTSIFEICWGRDLVKKYNYSKKIFILVSKYMGHRTVNDTINILELEPNDDIKICYDLFNPNIENEALLCELLEDDKKLVSYLLTNRIAATTKEFEQHRDKSNDYNYIEDKLEN
jgi:hypothetical protein